MRKIHNFSSFSSLYEADAAGLLAKSTEASKLYDQTLGLILTTALNSYSSELTFPVKSYDANIDADMASVKSAPVTEKPEALMKIMAKVKQASVENTTKGAQDAIDAWVAAGDKGAEALEAMINQYKDQPEELKYINDYINAKIDSYLKGIQDSSKSNDLKAEISKAVNDSFSYEADEEIFEGIFQGKKGMIEDVAKQVTLVTAKLASLAQTPGMSAEVQKLQTEVNQIAAKMGDLLDKKNSEISKEDIKKAATRLAEIPTEADKTAEKMLKQDSTNKEAAAILVQALALVKDAKDKEVIYLQNKEQALQKDKDSKIKVKLSIDRIDYDPAETKKVNPEVKKFQELVADKFGKIKMITSLPQYSKMGSDGKFGQNTRDIVKVLKKGFDLSDSSGDITRELVDEIQVQADTIKESINSRVYTFSDFVIISEASFNAAAAVEYAKSLPTYTATSTSTSSSGSSSGSKSPGGSFSSMLFKEGSKGPEVRAIQNAVGAVIKGTDEEKDQTFGPKTKEAVMAWQKSNGLKEDGIVGPGTIKKMAEIKNLGNWTASMISKLANVEVKPFVKQVNPKERSIEDIGQEVKNLASLVIAGSSGAGTNEGKVKKGIELIKSVQDLKDLNTLLKISSTFGASGTQEAITAAENKKKAGVSSGDYSNLQDLINGEMGSDDVGIVQTIVDHLKKIGAKASFEVDNEGNFVEDSFRVTI